VSGRVVRLLGLGLRGGGGRVVVGVAGVRAQLQRGPGAFELGHGLGRPPVQAVGVADAALARGLVGSLEE
jgi:hypothetical protein